MTNANLIAEARRNALEEAEAVLALAEDGAA